MTFIQKGKRGGDAEMPRVYGDMEQTVTWPHVVDENQEGYLRSKRAQPQARPHSPVFQCQAYKYP